MAIICCMDHSIRIDLAEPHIVTLSIGVEYIDSDIRIAHLGNDSAVSTISDIHSAILCRCITS